MLIHSILYLRFKREACYVHLYSIKHEQAQNRNCKGPLHFAMTTTTTQTTVEATLVQLVAEYCQLEKEAQSKYFPLTEKAIDLFEHSMTEEQVSKQFRLAFAQANGMESREFTKHVEYRSFRDLVRRFVKIAKCGRKWYDEQRAKQIGFHSMYKLAVAHKTKPNPTETESNTEHEAGESPPPDIFISKFCKQVADEGQRFLDSRFFTKLATLVDSVENGQIEQYSEVVTMLKRLVAASSEALEKLEK